MACQRGPMTNSPVDLPIHHYVYPSQMAFLVLVTLCGCRELIYGKQRIVARGTIIFLTIADFCLLLSMLPQSLATFQWFYENETCRRFIHYSKITVNAWSNVFSAAEVFFTVAICVECYLRARGSKLVRFFMPGVRYYVLAFGIFALSFTIAFYHFFLYELKTGYRCDGQKLVSMLMTNRQLTPNVIRFLNLTQGFVVIVVPCLLVTYINYRLERSLKVGKLPFSTNECQELFSNSETVSISEPYPVKYIRAITIVFVLSHILSFVPFLYDIIPSIRFNSVFPALISIMNSVLVSGKLVTLVLLFKNCKILAKTGYY